MPLTNLSLISTALAVSLAGSGPAATSAPAEAHAPAPTAAPAPAAPAPAAPQQPPVAQPPPASPQQPAPQQPVAQPPAGPQPPPQGYPYPPSGYGNPSAPYGAPGYGYATPRAEPPKPRGTGLIVAGIITAPLGGLLLALGILMIADADLDDRDDLRDSGLIAGGTFVTVIGAGATLAGVGMLATGAVLRAKTRRPRLSFGRTRHGTWTTGLRMHF